ncbi:LysM peptidoglycan-binding and 3D domain-containing protein [Metabacillus bambusae]|uniref:LysM peptidoglycan-binding domain-containing protein n=1 Tax=Metabacillus bambusae TaxID=2795218 RepID=A0ABS3MX59_9BACI|nr:3D domain-containing protein [Metabacillus bambusae]MBO1510615.1 LysM peptidoglycan-binding domain-containing protein [Metabacillus bambusae]
MKKGILSIITATALSVGFAANASAAVVTVEEGDTLWDLADQKGLSVEDIKEWNDLSGDIIHPEDKLKLQEHYEIVEGDSLWDIAKENNVSINELKELNEIDSHIIHPGDELIIEDVNTEDAEPEQTKATPQQKVKSKVETDSKASTEQPVEEKLTVTATAYTANCEGCSGTTKTGIDLIANPDKKVIAVDPDVIPLGSKVHVEGYGEAIAGDIGGAITGNRIDVFIPSESKAKKWGRKKVEVKILD